MSTALNDLIREAETINSALERACESVDAPRLVKWGDEVELAHIEQLGPTADEGVDLGYHVADDLIRIIRIAYPAGTYHLSYARGTKAQMADFMAGLPAPDWSLTEEVVLTKHASGEVAIESVRQPESDEHDETDPYASRGVGRSW